AAMKTNKNTVGRLRKKVEATVPIGTVEKRVGKDGKARKQPTRKARKQPVTKVKQVGKAAVAPPHEPKAKAVSSRELEAAQAHIAELETAREHDTDLAEKLRMAEIKIVGLEAEIEELKAENTKLREQLKADADDGLDIPACLRRAPAKAVA